jgi:hypothetical protein
MADYLTYFIADQMLVGDVNGIHFQEAAVSGGRAGRNRAHKDGPTSKETLPPVAPSLANNVWRTDKKGVEHSTVIGGPIPCGEYTVTNNTTNEDFRLDLKAVSLIPVVSNGTRVDLQIHGRGLWGSYGCIVVLDYAKLTLLYNAVKSSHAVRLNVVAGEIHDAG